LLCKEYVNIINRGSVPVIENVWVYICQQQQYKAIKDVVEMIEKYLQGVSLPLTKGQLSQLK